MEHNRRWELAHTSANMRTAPLGKLKLSEDFKSLRTIHKRCIDYSITLPASTGSEEPVKSPE